ncbi:MAG TPA: SDR family oxidoreductase [Steroidobacteraceae bacterium]|nr:SDR family oxidoreductase [Steroidobacteraceae bacterium]
MPSVLITGASRGLGLELARQYAADRWTVYAACRDPAGARGLAEISARESRESFSVLPMDVTDASSVAHAARAVSGPLDVLINNAGIMGGNQSFGRMDYEGWDEVLRVNTIAPLRVTEAFASHLERGERRLIVTITSGLASIGDNTSGGWIAYRSSKAAVNMVMRSLAVGLASRRITCVVVSPGWVQTDMGGPSATLTAAESVSALRSLFARLRPSDSGKFFGHDGKELAW